MQIVPTILVKSQSEFQQRLRVIKKLGLTTAQLDIMDGLFVKNITWVEADIIRRVKGVSFELHLMVKNPLKYVSGWSKLPGVKKFIVHAETINTKQWQQLKKITKSARKQLFIALKPQTKFASLQKFSGFTGIQVMTVHPGWGGQPFITSQLAKIRQLRKSYPDVIIEVDGGINGQTAKLVKSAGVNIISVGRYLSSPSVLRSLQSAK